MAKTSLFVAAAGLLIPLKKASMHLMLKKVNQGQVSAQKTTKIPSKKLAYNKKRPAAGG